jgi:hypothetical protein
MSYAYHAPIPRSTHDRRESRALPTPLSASPRDTSLQGYPFPPEARHTPIGRRTTAMSDDEGENEEEGDSNVGGEKTKTELRREKNRIKQRNLRRESSWLFFRMIQSSPNSTVIITTFD